MGAAFQIQNLQQYESTLRAYAFSLTRSKEESDDLVQDTFYRAISNLDKFSDGTNVKAWLYTIMRNIFINNYRRKKNHRTTYLPIDNQAAWSGFKKHENNTSSRSLLAEDITKALNKVSSNFTEPFMMYYRGFRYDEIAEKLSIPVGTVKSRIFFARKELQAKLAHLEIYNSAA
ncbi:MAG: RNA polymerase sigma factor [Bacteroidetes bacterium]|jgi:RNA polymerase sigma-70 factor (ECF subfamily)|nr:RNA polymerase sigma factor [Bacteroidota bacterium]